MKWQIYFDDGTTWHHSQGLPPPEKSFGVLVIIQQRADDRYSVMQGKDYYLYVEDWWITVDEVGLVDYLVHRFKSIQGFLVVRMAGDLNYQAIYKQAKLDGENGSL